MNVQEMMRRALAHHTLHLMSKNSPLKNFSWQRVKIALLNISRCEATYIEDYLQINFLWHQHTLWLHKNGRGLLFNPYDENSPKYRLVMPVEIQALVQEVWDANKTPIPINPALN